MGIGTHISLNDFDLVTRITAETSINISPLGEAYTFAEGDYITAVTYPDFTSSTYYEYNAGIGFIYNGSTNTTYFFSDSSNSPVYKTNYTTSQNTEDWPIRSTLTYEASSSTYFLEPFEIVSTTWVDITTTNTTRNRLYTEIASIGSVPFGVFAVECNRTNDVRVIIEPRIGQNWTVDGSALEYYQLFLATGEYVATHSVNYFDSNLQTTINAETTELFPTVSSRFGLSVTSNYEVTNFSETIITITKEQAETIVNEQLYLTSAETETIGTVKKVISLGTFSYILGESFSETTSSGSRRAVFAERITEIPTTATFYVVDNFYTYNSSFTYSGLVQTTAMYSYSLGSAAFGTSSSSTQFTFISGTETITASQSGYESKPALGTRFFVEYYSILLGTELSIWNKSYAQAYVFNPFALAFTSETANRYAASIDSPYDVVFTSYKFDVLNDFSVDPKIYIPINATEFSYPEESTNSSSFTKIVQSVDIPSEFYYGSSKATVSRTTFTVNPTTVSTAFQSKDIGYVGSQTTGFGVQIGKNDFQNQFWNPPLDANRIMHTIGVLGKSSASYSMDGYIVYNSLFERTFAGDSVNPISIIGNGQITTIIGSSLVSSRFAFPYVLNKVSYVNSYL